MHLTACALQAPLDEKILLSFEMFEENGKITRHALKKIMIPSFQASGRLGLASELDMAGKFLIC